MKYFLYKLWVGILVIVIWVIMFLTLAIVSKGYDGYDSNYDNIEDILLLEDIKYFSDMYYENSMDVYEWIESYINNNSPSNNVPYEYFTDEQIEIESISRYVDKYLSDMDKYSKERINKEIDIFISLFKDDFSSDKDFNSLVRTREYIFNTIKDLE